MSEMASPRRGSNKVSGNGMSQSLRLVESARSLGGSPPQPPRDLASQGALLVISAGKGSRTRRTGPRSSNCRRPTDLVDAGHVTEDWPNAHLIHLPVHASWLNQIEIYFSVLQRKVLDPNDIADLDELQQRLLAFQRLYQKAAQPFEWKFTRQDLAKLLQRLTDQDRQQAA